jgi:hypothetical protein
MLLLFQVQPDEQPRTTSVILLEIDAQEAGGFSEAWPSLRISGRLYPWEWNILIDASPKRSDAARIHGGNIDPSPGVSHVFDT